MEEILSLKFAGKFRGILVFGPPGVGKGTISKTLAAHGGHYHCSTGEIFRGWAPSSPVGALISSYTKVGNLVPDSAVLGIWRSYMNGLIATNRFNPDSQILFLDGIPRTRAQVALLAEHVDIEAVIVLEMARVDGLITRMQGRARKEGRADDADPEVIRRRFEVYMRETAPVLEAFRPELLYKVNADQPLFDVLRDVLIALSPKLS